MLSSGVNQQICSEGGALVASYDTHLAWRKLYSSPPSQTLGKFSSDIVPEDFKSASVRPILRNIILLLIQLTASHSLSYYSFQKYYNT